MPGRTRSRRVTRSRKSHKGGFSGLGGVINQLSVPFTLLAVNHHVGKKRHSKKHHSKKHHSKKHHSKKHHSKMRGGTRKHAKRTKRHRAKRNRKSRKGRKHVKGGIGIPGMGMFGIDSKENKFITKIGEAIVLLNNQSVPFPPGGRTPFESKVGEINALVMRNRGSNRWDGKRKDEIRAKIREFQEALDKKDKTILDAFMKDMAEKDISSWKRSDRIGMGYT